MDNDAINSQQVEGSTNLVGRPEGSDALEHLSQSGELEQKIKGWARLVNSLEGSAVLAVTGPWGTGKTTALKLLERELQKSLGQPGKSKTPEASGPKVCRIDAWANDDLEDPLLALVSGIQAGLADQTNLQKLSQIAGKYLVPLGLVGAKGVLSAAGLSAIVQLCDSLQAEMNSDPWSELEAQLRCRDEIRKQFKAELSHLAGKNKLILILDELDRCRPDFAVRLLERVKHFFEVENVVVILGADLDALSKTVKSVYGAEFNGREYLERFIHLELELAFKPTKALIETVVLKFGLETAFKRNNRWRDGKEAFIETIFELSGVSGWSIRRIERSIGRLAVAFHQLNDRQTFQGPLLALAIWMSLERPKQIEDFAVGNIDLLELITELAEKLSNESRDKMACVIGGYVGWIGGEDQRRTLKKALRDPIALEGLRQPALEMCETACAVAESSSFSQTSFSWIVGLIRI